MVIEACFPKHILFKKVRGRGGVLLIRGGCLLDIMSLGVDAYLDERAYSRKYGTIHRESGMKIGDKEPRRLFGKINRSVNASSQTQTE